MKMRPLGIWVGILVTVCVWAQVRKPAPQPEAARLIVQHARSQLIKPAQYDASYRRIAYPMGDVDPGRGVCTDVVIRALRAAGYDLQKLIHEDMARPGRKYPRKGKTRDSNIDHRRVPNQVYFLRRFGQSLTLKTDRRSLDQWKPGDLVYWKLDNGLDHTGIISDRKNAQGLPLVIHNIWQTAEEDVLTRWRIVGHFRFPKP